MLLCLPGLPALPAPQTVQLVSLLPAQPIEDPNLWAWGRHPNGLGYKERVTLFLLLANYQNKVEVYELLVNCWWREDWVTVGAGEGRALGGPVHQEPRRGGRAALCRRCAGGEQSYSILHTKLRLLLLLQDHILAVRAEPAGSENQTLHEARLVLIKIKNNQM